MVEKSYPMKKKARIQKTRQETIHLFVTGKKIGWRIADTWQQKHEPNKFKSS